MKIVEVAIETLYFGKIMLDGYSNNNTVAWFCLPFKRKNGDWDYIDIREKDDGFWEIHFPNMYLSQCVKHYFSVNLAKEFDFQTSFRSDQLHLKVVKGTFENAIEVATHMIFFCLDLLKKKMKNGSHN
jgi:hypothetical protein